MPFSSAGSQRQRIFDAAEQIGLRARHLEQPLRLEGGFGAENVGVRLEADPGAPAVVDLAEIFELALGMTALERHLVELLLARDLDLEQRGQRVDHGDADAVQAARGLVDLGVELAAGMQRAHDDFERGFFRKFRMRIDRNAAAIVGHGQKAVGAEFDLDEGGMARQRLVHGVVDDFGEQMMQRLLVGAADIHAGAAAHRLQAFEHLDVGRGVAGLGAGGARGDLGRRRGPSVPPRRGRCRIWFLQLISMIWTWLFMCCARAWRGESVSLTMPWMGSKSDGAGWKASRPGVMSGAHR